MSRVDKHKKLLGQFMTPDGVANVLARYLPSDAECVVDLASGDCSLLRAVQKSNPQCALLGCEIDPKVAAQAMLDLPPASVICGDGMTSDLSSLLAKYKKISVVGNPPFTEVAPTQGMTKLLHQAFPGLSNRMGSKRLELYFLAKALLLARQRGGKVSMIMPISFADGDIYSQYRRELVANYCLESAVEIPEGVFGRTEARTILIVIDPCKTLSKNVQVCRLDSGTAKLRTIYKGAVAAGERLDARYWSGKGEYDQRVPRLQDIGVTVTRGKHSRKAAEALAIGAIHTSDLRLATDGILSLGQRRAKIVPGTFADPAEARAGDILLSRTGSRVTWLPVLVDSGTAPITDHVFCIRAPDRQRMAVLRAFRHPQFDKWLQSVSKGVCATVLTKRELLLMPLFR